MEANSILFGMYCTRVRHIQTFFLSESIKRFDVNYSTDFTIKLSLSTTTYYATGI